MQTHPYCVRVSLRVLGCQFKSFMGNHVGRTSYFMQTAIPLSHQRTRVKLTYVYHYPWLIYGLFKQKKIPSVSLTIFIFVFHSLPKIPPNFTNFSFNPLTLTFTKSPLNLLVNFHVRLLFLSLLPF